MRTHLLSPLKILAAGLCIALIPAFAFGQPSSFPSQPYTWKNVTVKGGGFICGVVFNTTQPDLAYCRTRHRQLLQVGQPGEEMDSADGLVPATTIYFGSESIATDPIDPQRVYIAAGMDAGPAGGHPAFDGPGQDFSDRWMCRSGWAAMQMDGAWESVWPLIRTTTTFSISARARPGFGSAKTRR